MVLLLLRTLLSALALLSAFVPGQVEAEAGVLASLAAAPPPLPPRPRLMVLLLLRTLLSALALMSALAPGQVDTEAGVLASLAAAPPQQLLRACMTGRTAATRAQRVGAWLRASCALRSMHPTNARGW